MQQAQTQVHEPPDPSLDQVLLNQQSYDAIARHWWQVRTTLGPREQQCLDLLAADLAVGDTVLDLGCGNGQPMASWFLDRGLQVTGIDQSAEMLALAREAYPQARWLQHTLPEFELAGRFNAIVLWDVLFHLPRDDHRTLLVRCRDSLLPGGRLMLTSGGSADAAFTDTMFENRFFYDSLAPSTLQSVMQDLGFHIELMDVINPPTDGRDKGRIAIVARTAHTTAGT